MDPKKNTEQPVIPEVMVQMTSVVCDEILKFLSKVCPADTVVNRKSVIIFKEVTWT